MLTYIKTLSGSWSSQYSEPAEKTRLDNRDDACPVLRYIPGMWLWDVDGEGLIPGMLAALRNALWCCCRFSNSPSKGNLTLWKPDDGSPQIHCVLQHHTTHDRVIQMFRMRSGWLFLLWALISCISLACAPFHPEWHK